ncbi:t-SNARE affecting a late Golgi compartment protein 1 [Monosporozyma unispora]|nr:hypothetical protein C6P44_005040 [Kazachstania unispora]
MSVEDPFDQVLEDTKEQLTRLTNYLPSHGIDNEVIDIIKDVQDTINDLERSLLVMQRSSLDTQQRETNLTKVRVQLNQFIKDYNIDTTAQSSFVPAQTNFVPQEQQQPIQQIGEVKNSTNGDVNNGPSTGDALQEQMLQEQDVHLDNIHHTMQNLHLQAQTMGEELEDQGQLLDDLDTNFDSVTNKLNRSRRQLEWVYEKNKEKFNDCCIILLIIALIVLLVLAFIA